MRWLCSAPRSSSKLQIGDDAQAQPVGELGAQEAAGVAQRLDRLFAVRVVAEHRDRHGRVPQVGGHVDR